MKISRKPPGDVVTVFSKCYFQSYTGGVYLRGNVFFEPSAFHTTKVDKIVKSGRFLKMRALKCATTIGHGPWDNYYHWYIDSIPRLWALHTSEMSNMREIVLPVSRKLSNDEMRLIECLLPKNVSVVRVGKYIAYRADTFVFLPFLSGARSGRLPKEYLDFYRKKVFNEFAIERTPSKFKIFISRRASNTRSFMNQDEVEEFLKHQGFDCLQLERLPVVDQITYFANASVVVASHGAGLTNLLYASSCEVIEIFHDRIQRNLNHYRDLAESLNLNYSSIFLDGNSKNARVNLPTSLLETKLGSITLDC